MTDDRSNGRRRRSRRSRPRWSRPARGSSRPACTIPHCHRNRGVMVTFDRLGVDGESILRDRIPPPVPEPLLIVAESGW